jgi:predicted outer membrane repeat protein
MPLTQSELEREAGTVLCERATPFVISLGHLGSNFAATFANNQAVAVNGGGISALNFVSAGAGQAVITNQG